MIKEHVEDHMLLFLNDNQLLFNNQGHESFNKLPSLMQKHVGNTKEETSISMKLLEENYQTSDNNEFIDCDEYISLILHNQSINDSNIMNKKLSDDRNDLRKYFNLWRETTKNGKNDNTSKNNDDNNIRNRSEMIDHFFENIIKNRNEINNKNKLHHENKSDVSSNNSSEIKSVNAKYETGTFHHRYRAQKNIIALQKMKIQQQERVIEELKLKKIVEDVEANTDILFDVRKTLQYCDRNLKPKLKCIIGEEEKNTEDADDIIVPYCTKVPKFIQQMEQRARQREEKRAIVRERRRQLDLEKQKAKEQMELEKQIMDQDEKNRRLNEYKEKRKQEQLIAIRRKEIREKLRALNVMADLHYEKKITVKYGISAFRKYLVRIQEDYDLAVKHHTLHLVRNHFIAWRSHTKITVQNRNDMADRLYHTKIWRWVFQEFKMEHRTMVKKWQVAEDWYEYHITERLFLTWRHNIRKIRYFRKKQWSLAVQHYNIQLLWKVVGCWQTLPTINKLEREHESRKQKWRLKVQQVLPDFIPHSIEEDDSKYI